MALSIHLQLKFGNEIINHLPRKRTVHWLLALLLPALLLAQWAGFSHRIAHANLSSTVYSPLVALDKANVSSELASNPSQPDTRLHSCAIFDALTVAEFLQSATWALSSLHNHAIQLDSRVYSQWHAPFLRLFSSRARRTPF